MPEFNMEDALRRALAAYEMGRLAEAELICRDVLNVDANQAFALHILGVVAHRAGKHAPAESLLRQAAALRPEWPEVHNNLANVLREQGKLEEAHAAYREALKLRATYADALVNLGSLELQMGDAPAAADFYHQALAIEPQNAEIYVQLANAQKDMGQTEAAVQNLRQALACRPHDPAAHSNLLFTQLYLEQEPETHFQELRRWDHFHGEPLRNTHKPHGNDRSPDRRLRIGYLSADLRQHVCHLFTESLFRHHDHAQFEIFTYAQVKRPDVVTDFYQKQSDHWLITAGMSDDALAARIREDQIDILVDPMGHAPENRLPVLARKPAPIQVTYLSYPASTGLLAMDYRLTDAVADPPGFSETWHTEELIRLPGCFLCFTPLDSSPEPAPTPALQAGHVTFGCFNRMSKCSDATLEMWAGILRQVPTSRLLIKAISPMSPIAWDHLLARLTKLGITKERLELRDRSPSVFEHLATYHHVDIALDTYPFNGAATTCEALWMGVPVITRAGRAHVTRVGASLLGAVGLEECVAHSAQEYVDKAVALANDLPRLIAIRQNLRPRMAASPLRNEAGFTRNLETAYREMWRKWCTQPA